MGVDIVWIFADRCTFGGEKGGCFCGSKRTWVTRVTGFWHNPGLKMTKTELQSALAEATQTDKRTAGVFLDTLGALAYKEIKKNGEFVLPGFGKLVKQKRKARTGFNPKTQQKIKIPATTLVKFRVAEAAKDGVLGPFSRQRRNVSVSCLVTASLQAPAGDLPDESCRAMHGAYKQIPDFRPDGCGRHGGRRQRGDHRTHTGGGGATGKRRTIQSGKAFVRV
jgi:DNA-binding protein HU-beta